MSVCTRRPTHLHAHTSPPTQPSSEGGKTRRGGASEEWQEKAQTEGLPGKWGGGGGGS